MTAWNELVSVALVGTGRRQMPDHVVAAVASALGTAPPEAAPETAVLNAAGVLAAHRRAGWTPVRHETAPLPAPRDDRPTASSSATQLLELLLDGQVAVPGGASLLVVEWLTRCESAGRRPPDRLLPRLIAVATSDRSLRDVVASSAGARLAWLAQHNPEWSWAAAPGAAPQTPDDAEVTWTTGTQELRMATLRAVRSTSPGDARRLLGQTWSTDDARSRTAFLAVLADNLDDDDEPLLEAALDDRSKSVREVAAELLDQLPSSRRADRMTARLRPLVTIGGRFRKRLDVALPDEPDAAARRDGITDGGAPTSMGPRTWWLVQLVAATPLSFWTEHAGADPDAVVRMIESRDVRAGLVLATVAQREPRWALALVPHQAEPALLSVVPAADVGAVAAAVLASATDQRLARVLWNVEGPWPPDLSDQIVRRLRAATSPLFLQDLPLLAARLDTSVGPAIERWVDDLRADDHARRQVRGLAHALSIRQTIFEEFS